MQSLHWRRLRGQDLGITSSSSFIGVQGLELADRLPLKLISKAFTITRCHCHAMHPETLGLSSL